MKRKKVSKEMKERKGEKVGEKEGKRKKGRRERGASKKKRVRNCGKNRFYLEITALYIISMGFPCKP